MAQGMGGMVGQAQPEFYISSSSNGQTFKCEEKCNLLKFVNNVYNFSSPI